MMPKSIPNNRTKGFNRFLLGWIPHTAKEDNVQDTKPHIDTAKPKQPKISKYEQSGKENNATSIIRIPYEKPTRTITWPQLDTWVSKFAETQK